MTPTNPKNSKGRTGRSSSRARAASPRPLGPTALLETLLGGWRPLSRLDVDGFAILRSRGVTRRANSIVPIDPPQDAAALASALDRIESLVAASDAPVLFRVLPEGGHEAIDAFLAERGYAAEGASDVLEAPLSQKVPAPDARALIETGPLPETWFDRAWRLAPRSGDGARETMHDILAGTPAVHVTIGADGAPGAGEQTGGALAVGRAALVDQGRSRTAVLDEIAVDPEHRREGLGTAVVRTLLAAASVQGADRALLEVEADNTGARGLYRGLGFSRIAGYHYRVRA